MSQASCGVAMWLIAPPQISLYVYMEMLKIVMAWRIDNDVEMYHAETNTPPKANTSNLAEELGQVEYIFSDKTGTLTSNTMFFRFVHFNLLPHSLEGRRCTIKGRSYGEDPDDEEPVLADEEKEKPNAPEEVKKPLAEHSFRLTNVLVKAYIFREEALLRALEEADGGEPSPELMFFKILALCHTVIISNHLRGADRDENEDEKEDMEMHEMKCKDKDKESSSSDETENSHADGEHDGLVYEAASPDEAALVGAARRLGVVFCVRNDLKIRLSV